MHTHIHVTDTNLITSKLCHLVMRKITRPGLNDNFTFYMMWTWQNTNTPLPVWNNSCISIHKNAISNQPLHWVTVKLLQFPRILVYNRAVQSRMGIIGRFGKINHSNLPLKEYNHLERKNKYSCTHTHTQSICKHWILCSGKEKKTLAREIQYTTVGYRPHGRNRKECHPGNHQQQF